VKLDRQQEFVIGGDRPGPKDIDALLIGYYDGQEAALKPSKLPALRVIATLMAALVRV